MSEITKKMLRDALSDLTMSFERLSISLRNRKLPLTFTPEGD